MEEFEVIEICNGCNVQPAHGCPLHCYSLGFVGKSGVDKQKMEMAMQKERGKGSHLGSLAISRPWTGTQGHSLTASANKLPSVGQLEAFLPG